MGLGDMLSGITGNVKNSVENNASNQISNSISNKASKAMQGDNTPKCPKCKKPIADNSQKFCQQCGTKLLVTCAKCNKDFATGTKFCTECGGALG
jgi:membrane protease subunit (stomatin/prohibitin family)